MLQKLMRMPEPLQKQILVRLGNGVLFFIISIVLIIVSRDIYLLIPCVGAAAIFSTAAILLFRRIVLGEYVVVERTCTEEVLTPVRRRAKYIILHTSAGKLKVALRSRMRKVSAGATVRLYLANDTTIYEQDGCYVIYAYIALHVGTVRKNNNEISE